MKESLLHFDPITLLTVVAAMFWAWVKYIRKSDATVATVEWLTGWAKKHSDECDEQRKSDSLLLIELKTANAHLVTLTEAQDHRIGRIEQQMDRAERGR